MTTNYNILSYFQAGKTQYWAKYVDNKSNGGNQDGHVNNNEIEVFKKIIKHRYDFDYDFTRLDSEQSNEIAKKDENENFGRSRLSIAEDLYHSEDFRRTSMGMSVSNDLDGLTLSYSYTKNVMEKIATFPIESKKYNLIKDFLLGFTVADARNGFFEQLGSEYGEGITNGEAVKFLEAIKSSIPQEKRMSDDYMTIEEIYNEYKNKPADEKFEDSKFSLFSSFFSLNTLDQLDDAVERLFGL